MLRRGCRYGRARFCDRSGTIEYRHTFWNLIFSLRFVLCIFVAAMNHRLIIIYSSASNMTLWAFMLLNSS